MKTIRLTAVCYAQSPHQAIEVDPAMIASVRDEDSGRGMHYSSRLTLKTGREYLLLESRQEVERLMREVGP